MGGGGGAAALSSGTAAAAGLQAAAGAPVAHPVVKAVGKAPGYFASITVAGVADESPEEVFARFLHPLGHPSIFSSVLAVEELSRTEHSSEGRTEVEIRQTVALSLFGKRLSAPMRLRLTADHKTRQLSFVMLEGNALMRRIEGVYAVLPCHEHQSERDVLAAATGLFVGSPACCSGAGGPCTGGRRRAGADGGSGAQRSIVVLHQKVKPFMTPPPPFGRLLRGHLAGQFETMMQELLEACRHSVLSRRSRAAAAPPAHPAERALQYVGGLFGHRRRLPALPRPPFRRGGGWDRRGVAEGLALGGAAVLVVAGLFKVMASAERAPASLAGRVPQ